MKPFDLKAALAGKPVVTRDGRKILRIVHLPEAMTSKLVVVREDGVICHYPEDGMLFNPPSGSDLMMATEKQTVAVNIYQSPNGKLFVGKIHTSLESAVSAIKSGAYPVVGTITGEIEL